MRVPQNRPIRCVTDCMCVCRLGVYINRVCTLMETGLFKLCRVGQQDGDPRMSQCYSSSSKAFLQNSFLLGASQSFCSLRPSADGTRSTHIIEGHLLYSKAHHLNVNLIPRQPNGNTQIVFHHISDHHGPAKVTPELNHHRLILYRCFTMHKYVSS
jgi:hypothetical protein